MSYVRGFHKSTRSTGGEYSKPVALRGTGNLTVVLGVFHNAVLGKSVTLAITLWATQEAGQPNRFYSLTEADQSIAADFSNFGQDPVLLKKQAPGRRRRRPRHLRALRRGVQAAVRHQRQPGHGAVPPHGVHEAGREHHLLRAHQHARGGQRRRRIGNLIHHFDDLKKAHDAVLRAKDQIALLTPITEGAAQHADAEPRGRVGAPAAGPAAPVVHRPKTAAEPGAPDGTGRTGNRLQEDSTASCHRDHRSCGTTSQPSRTISAATAADGWQPSTPRLRGSRGIADPAAALRHLRRSGAGPGPAGPRGPGPLRRQPCPARRGRTGARHPVRWAAGRPAPN